jgi:ABC-2 type transport system permease protein
MTTASATASPRVSTPLSTLGAQIKAEFLTMIRSPSALVPTLLFPIMFWVFFGLPNARGTMQSGFNVGAYVLSSFATYSLIQTVLFNLGIFIAIERSTGWYRFQRTTPVRVWVMFTAKLIGVLMLGLIALGLLLTVGSITGGINLPITIWLSLVARVLLGVLPFAALAVFIGYLAKGTSSASPILNLIFFPMAFGSGLFIPLSQLPKIVQDIAPFLPAYHGGELARSAIGVPSAQGELTNVLVLLGFTALFLVVAVWAYKRDEGANYR